MDVFLMVLAIYIYLSNKVWTALWFLCHGKLATHTVLQNDRWWLWQKVTVGTNYFFWDGFANCNIRIPCMLRWWPCSPQFKLIWLKQRLVFCGTLGLQWETMEKRCAYSSRIFWKILLLKSHDNEPLLITISHQKLYYIMPYTPKKHNSSVGRAFVFIKV